MAKIIKGSGIVDLGQFKHKKKKEDKAPPSPPCMSINSTEELLQVVDQHHTQAKATVTFDKELVGNYSNFIVGGITDAGREILTYCDLADFAILIYMLQDSFDKTIKQAADDVRARVEEEVADYLRRERK